MSTLFALLFSGQFFIAESEITAPVLNMSISVPQKDISESVEITAESALIMEVSSGMVIFGKNIHEQRSIASLTKLMTALVVLEEENIWNTASVSEEAVSVEGSSMYLLTGESLRISDLLIGVLVRSANDAALVLAEQAGESVKEFVQMMNRRAHYLGMKNTHFSNPHGLDDPENYSTAFDVALLSKKMIESDFVRRTAQIRKTSVSDITNSFSHELKTTNMLLSSPFSIYGLKTGTTDQAGECFVGLTKISGKEYLIVILGSSERFQDTKALIWAIRKG